MDAVRDHEMQIVRHGLRRFQELADEQGVALLGPTRSADASSKVGVFAFVVPGLHHGEASQALDRRWGIATRNGCFCAQPLLNQLLGLGVQPSWTRLKDRTGVEIPGAVRASVGVYNTEDDFDLLADGVAQLAREAKQAPSSPVRSRSPGKGTRAAKPSIRGVLSVDSS
jgi:cysteine desulfurase / selenocysteine lyase